jgi:hypothetical protein
MEEMMKTRMVLVIVIFLVSMFGMPQAQNSPIDKGSKIVGGGFSVVSTDRGHYKSMEMLINPSIGVFSRKGLLLGISLLFERYSEDNYSSTTYGLGPDIRYYFDPNKSRGEIKGSYYPYLKISGIYSKTMPRNDYFGYENIDYKNFEWAGGGGIQLMFSDAVGGYVEFNLGSYNYKVDSDGSWRTYPTTTLIAGFSFFLY